MQSKLTIYGGRVVDIDPIKQAALAEYCKIDFVIFATKNLPSHLNIAVSRDVYWSWRRFFGNGNAERPAAKNVPLWYARTRFQSHQQVFRRRSQRNLLDRQNSMCRQLFSDHPFYPRLVTHPINRGTLATGCLCVSASPIPQSFAPSWLAQLGHEASG